MSEDTNDQPGQQLAVRPQRQLVADIVPIFDSARFEHYGRIAAVMAQSTLVPATLRAGSREEAIANCIQVVEFADRANYSPFAVAQCASVVHGKLMFEGKLVDAMLQTKLGIELNVYYTGERGKDDRRIYVTDSDLTEDQYEALAPGKYPFGVRMIDGSIGEWKTFEKGGGVSKAWGGQQSEMQLAYKGKRTWSRMFKPSVMLGVLTEDEVGTFDDRRLEAAAPEFADAPKPARRPRKAETPPASDEPGARAEGPSAASEAATDGENAQDAEFEDVQTEERPTSEADDTATGGVQSAEAAQDSPASAETAPEASQEQTDSSPPPTSERTEHGSTAPRDTVYRLSSDEPGDDGKIPTYKNGKAFSKVKPDAKVMPPIFDVHADAEAPEEAQAEERPRQDPDTRDAAGDTVAAIREAQSFEAGVELMKEFADTPGFKENVSDDAKRGVRLALWVRYGELLEEGLEGIEAHEHFTLMRLFLEFGAKSAAEIDEQWRPFWRSTFKSVSESNQRAITDLMVKRKADLAAAS